MSLLKGFAAILVLGVWLTPAAAEGQNPLPIPNHPMDFGYYYVDDRYGDHRSSVNCYTNLYRASRFNYLTTDDWRSLLATSLQNASSEGRRIHLALDMDARPIPNPEVDMPVLSDLLDIARPFWGSIVALELSDEPEWAPAGQINRRVDIVISLLAAKGLARKPLGAVYNDNAIRDLAFPDMIRNSALEWVGIEAFIDAPEMRPTSCENVELLYQKVNLAKEKIGCTKDVVLVMMAYDRNGCWQNIDFLVDLQVATYLIAYDDPRVMAITMFAYGREGTDCNCGSSCGGAHFHPELIPAHKRIGERILNLSTPPVCGGGAPPPVSLPPCGSPARACGSGSGGGPGNLRASVVGFRVDLVWNAFGSDVVEYRIQHRWTPSEDWLPIGRMPGDQTSFSDSVREPPGVADEHFYRVRAWTGSGGPFSNEVRVVVYREAPSVPPVQVGPTGCAPTLPPTLRWQAVARATDYLVRVGFSDYPILFQGVQGTSYTINQSHVFPPYQSQHFDWVRYDYRWAVKACNNVGCTGFSPDWIFGPSCPPVQFGPSGCTGNQPVISWSSLPGASNYRLIVSDWTDGGDDFIVDAYPALPSYQTDLSARAGRRLAWKVRAVYSGIPGVWSDYVQFTPSCVAPTVAAVSPRAGPRAGGTQITITGTGFLAGSTVAVGGVAATNVTVVNATTMTARTAASVAGSANVAVTLPNGPSGTLSNGYTYFAPNVFTDDPLVAGVTVVKAQHVSELRQAVNVLRAAAGLPAAGWTDPTLGVGVTPIRAAHVGELRARLNEALTTIGYATPPYTDPTPTPGSTVIRAIHLQEIRERIRNITG